MTETERYADLHVHTNYSDGAFTPEEAVRYAQKVGLSAIAITDHDITGGLPAAMEEGAKIGVEVIPGIELSTELDNPEHSEMHILGYYMDWKNAGFQETLSEFRATRQSRAAQILDKLDAMGVKLNREKLYQSTGQGTIGRLHFAKAMVAEGYARYIGEAFDNFLGYGKPAYVPKKRLSPEEGIRLISSVGGLAVLAPPYYGNYSDPVLIQRLKDAGLRGIEAWHIKHPPHVAKRFAEIAASMGLLTTGGSDCHGAYDDHPAYMGRIKIEYRLVEAMKLALTKPVI
jgi:predicted metal-dependent phosphoesterase TrpH